MKFVPCSFCDFVFRPYSVHSKTDAVTLPAHCYVFGRFGGLSLAAHCLADCRFDSGVKWLIHVSSILTYRRKKSSLLRVDSGKQLSESSIRYYFCSSVSKQKTYLEKTFFMLNFSSKIFNALLVDMFSITIISQTFFLRLSIRILKTF